MQPSFVSQLFPESNVPLLEASLRAAHHRQMAIVNNLANLETPHYQRQDIDMDAFQRMLRRAIRERGENHPGDWELKPSEGYAVHQRRFPEIINQPGRAYPDRAPGDGPVRHDENNVVPEVELAALQKNTLAIQMLQQLFKRAVAGTATAARLQVQ